MTVNEFGDTLVDDTPAQTQTNEFGDAISENQLVNHFNETPEQAGKKVEQNMKTANDENVSLNQAAQINDIQWRKDNPKHWYDFLSRNANKFEQSAYFKQSRIFSSGHIAEAKISPEYQQKVGFYYNAMLEDYKKPYQERNITQEGFSLTGFANPMNLTSWVSRTYGKGDISAWLDAREAFVHNLPWTDSEKWKNLAVDFEKAVIELKGMPAKSAGGVFGLHSILQAPTAAQSRQDWFDYLQSKGFEGTKSYAVGKLYDMLGGVESPYWRRTGGAVVGGGLAAAQGGDLGDIFFGAGQGVVFTPKTGEGVATAPEELTTKPVEAKTPAGVPVTAPKIGAENDYAKFIGVQDNEGMASNDNLYDLKVDIPDHPKGSTVTAQTLREAGIELPGEKSVTEKTEQAEKPKGKSVTSIKNAVVDEERAARGLPAMQPAVRQKWGQAVQKAEEEIDFDPDYQKNLVDTLAEKPRAITDVEGAALDMRKVDLFNERSKADEAGVKAAESGDEATANAMKIRSAAIEDEFAQVDRASKYAGTETARGLAFRRAMMAEDYSVSAMETKKRAANNYKPLTAEQKSEIQQLHKQLEETQAQLEEARQKSEQKRGDVEMKRWLGGRTKTTPTAPRQAYGSSNRMFTKSAYEAARNRLISGNTLRAGIDPQGLIDLMVVGGYHFEALGRKAADFAKWSAAMIKDFGENAKPHLEGVWAKVKEEYTTKLKDERTKIIGKIQELVFNEVAVKDMTNPIQKLAENFIADGITDREELLDAVHNEIVALDPAVTRREVMDAISGYGQMRMLSKDEIKTQLRDFKGQMQQIAKLEDMANKQAPLKTGIERRTPSDTEKELIKMVNEEKAKSNFTATDPERELRSAVDELKARLNTRIKDYEDRLAKGDFAKKEHRTIIPDKDAMRLQYKLDRIKQKFQQGLKKDQLANRTMPMKIRDAFLAWRTAGILSGYTVLEKLSATALITMTATPAEEGVGSVLKLIAPKLMERAPRRGAGFQLRIEAKSLSEAVSKLGQDAADAMMKGETDYGLVYGNKEAVPPEAARFFGHVHMALKTAPRRAEFTRSYAKRAEWYARQGMDITEPINEMRIGMEALVDANAEIFLQDNFIVSAYKAGIRTLERPSKTTGKPTAAGMAVSTAIRTELPIVKIPTNLVGRIIEGATGLEVGTTKAVMAYIKGVQKLPPEQADIIARQIERGVIGTAMIATGMLLYKSLGGFYQPGEKRKKGEPAEHEIEVGDTILPKAFSHHPYVELMQVGATFMRVLDSRVKGKPAGWDIAAVKTTVSLLEAIPFVRTSSDLETLRRDPEKFFREQAEGIAVPQLAQQIAKGMDTDAQGRPIKRQTDTLGQQIESGIPVLREGLKKQR